jgi:hypothetical protein
MGIIFQPVFPMSPNLFLNKVIITNRLMQMGIGEYINAHSSFDVTVKLFFDIDVYKGFVTEPIEIFKY